MPLNPTPATDKFSISTTADKINLYGLSGKLIKTFDEAQNKLLISIEEIPARMYLMHIQKGM